jgi:glycosyltransferase involved in cell wall biosynthesis
MTTTNTYLAETLAIIASAHETHPDSRNLARHHAELLAQCGRGREALNACEAFLVRFGVDDELLKLALEVRQQVGPHDRLAESGKGSISLCMIVKNEEKYLPACLASLKPVVDEMVVVDTGSTDRTVDIAAVFGARVLHFPWNGNFSDARNYAIEQAKGAWVLVLDADEVVSQQDYARIKETVSSSGNQQIAWSVLTRNYTNKVHAQGWIANDRVYPLEERADGWHPSWKVRLFPNHPKIRFTGEVHEMVEESLRTFGYHIEKAPFVVHHYGGLEESDEEVAEKGCRYFEIGMKKLEMNPCDKGALAELAVKAGELGRFEEALQLWDRLLKIAPDAIDALFNKGYSLIKMQRYQEAFDISERVLEMVPGHKEAAFNYGTAALYLGLPDKAVEKLEPLLQYYSEYPPLLALLTLLYLLAGQREKGAATYATLKKLNYAISDYVLERAAVLVKLNKEKLARKLLDECYTIGVVQIEGVH